MMTTTNTFIGFEPNDKTSSKILKPPGGDCHNIFGDRIGSKVILVPHCRVLQPPGGGSHDIFGGTAGQHTSFVPRPTAPVVMLKAEENPPVQNAQTRNKSSIFDSDPPTANRNMAKKSGFVSGGYNPITGENGEVSDLPNASIRVRNPPGGPSTAL